MAKQTYKKLLELIPEEKMVIAKKLVDDIIFMNKLIDSYQKALTEDGAIDLFKSGKQEFLRANPASKALCDVTRQRNANIQNLINLIPKTIREGLPDKIDPFEDFLSERDQM